MADNPEPIEALIARGDYLGAAARATAGGDLPRAIQLYERVWRFADAVPLALALGDRPLAVRLSLETRDVAGAVAIAARIPASDGDALARAAAAFAARGHHHAAAELQVRAGRFEEAAALYQRSGDLLEAAAMLEKAGRWLEAGRLYERVATSGQDAGRAPMASPGGRAAGAPAEAQLALGRLLGALGRPLEAVRALQAAARHPATRAAAQRHLCGELLALGLHHAADEIARRLHREIPELPASAAAIAAAGAPATTSHGEDPDLPARQLPRRFTVIEALGSGALGRVYAARDELLGRTVALKVLSVGPGALGPEREAFLRFLREAEAIGRMHHPRIVTLHELDESAGLMVLEHLPGGTLERALARAGTLSAASARRMALDVLAALAAAHRAGIVHRDVTPANIFFDAAGNAKLGDFGAAHLNDFGHTQTGSFIGTLAYLSPEQITGSSIGFAADLYGLGATLYEALTGRAPFLGPDVVGQHLAERPTPPSLLLPGLLPAHDEVLLRALAKAPGDRFPSAESMAEAIERWPAFDPQAATTAAAALAGPGGGAPPPDSGAAPAEPTGAERDLGRTARGRLWLATDPRVGRQVLIERLDGPLAGDERERLCRLAAAGGPSVQRILTMALPSSSGAGETSSITYELLAGEERTLAELSPGQVALLADRWAELGPLGLPPAPDRRVILTDGGPVILLVRGATNPYPDSQ